MIQLDLVQFLGWMIVCGAIGTLTGAAIGYHAALTDAATKLKILNNRLNKL